MLNMESSVRKTIVLFLAIISLAVAKYNLKLLPVDRLRYEFFKLENQLWKTVNDIPGNDNSVTVGQTELDLIRKFENFGDIIQQNFDHDFTYGLDSLNSVWALQLAYADLRGIYALYESFRRFQRQQTAPGRIPSPKQAWIDLAESVLYDSSNSVEDALSRVQETMEQNLFQASAQVKEELHMKVILLYDLRGG